MENITLIGMPGSGKTTVGKTLAQALGMAFLDSDREIERCYVDHSAAGTSNAYTNLFHAQRGSSVGIIGIASGQKWCTPNSYVPIQSNAIYQNFYYGLGCRGNTKYNDYEGLRQFNVTGDFDPNHIP